MLIREMKNGVTGQRCTGQLLEVETDAKLFQSVSIGGLICLKVILKF